jgi:uncharacterized protein YccT (UPF0319 family)
LFILATETFTSAIKRNPEIRGITIDGTEYLDSLYADDTSLTLANDQNSFNATIKLLKTFQIGSGLNINMSKTIAIKLGEDKTYFNNEEGKDMK